MQTLITVSTSQSITDVSTAHRIALEDNYFGVTQVRNLKESMWKKGIEMGRDGLIFEIYHRNHPNPPRESLERELEVPETISESCE